MKTLNRNDFPGAKYTTRVVQFGEGNFLRAFLDWQLDILNEKTDLDAGVVIVRPLNTDFPPSLSIQDGLYTTLIRGLNEKNEAVKEFRMIRSVNNEINVYTQYDEYLELAKDPNIQFIFSNTTEAGISYVEGDKLTDRPAASYPAKLTAFLYERFTHFAGSKASGLIIIPCELIDYNGDALKKLVLKYAKQWNLSDKFIAWIENDNVFCSTLVDRIVPGYPKAQIAELEAELGYKDNFIDSAEYFYLFVIQGPQWLAQKLCLDKCNMNIKIVDDIKPYKERKVAILNGAHTALVPVAYLSGIDTVGEAMNDPQILAYIKETIFDEIIPVLDLPHQELVDFAQSVISRFKNPFIEHQLMSIALNSITKFKTRILPQLIAYQKDKGVLPTHLVFAFAALMAFYRGVRNNQTYPLQDDATWLARFHNGWANVAEGKQTIDQLVHTILSDKAHWEHDLLTIPQLAQTITQYLTVITQDGMRQAIEKCVVSSK
ncbi:MULTISPECIES: tagaturonate reductase [unclassified Gilliamella]|uniref:tagaturonate reductase n=1 Tax=unclassified Gilliamella TaxID=2685620 RepID=UPI00226A2D99|nr:MULTISPECIES: tagaturonate reductase [unclassified Gilliamella]MCX8641374.1 tagaturonate reductase [Gilliamella sp. B3835]MCX8707484.1 tagaturonate reductase [Gilliamella sp. B3783]MCX8710564.1 tagaturonate reductase [Gilliamella sp. B3780]MCX8714679.1 tagaturonate reductase [Gilliamella sp. B3781]MCX8716509.1 tagaturonate reductase [Gilliamella sp. B3784]